MEEPEILQRYRRIEREAAPWLSEAGVKSLRWGLVIMYVWFGFAKLFAPGDGLGIVNGLIAMVGLPSSVVIGLGVWEILIGVLFIRSQWTRLAAALATVHLLGTFIPLFALREMTFAAPIWLTLQGQFILKNIALHGGAWILWGIALQRDINPFPSRGTVSSRRSRRGHRRNRR